jgi:predicted glycoside hydrolase/deacetylase ChbG (UPF0249 family)
VKRLLVVADDWGLTPGVNRGITKAFSDGILTSASFLTNTRHFAETVRVARDLRGLKVGIHLTLVGGVPVLAPSRVPSLLGSGGAFRSSWRRFLPAWWSGRVRPEEVRSEWRAQIAKAVDAGIRPAHLDSHQHLHVVPALWHIALDLAAEFQIPRIRLPRQPAPDLASTPLRRRLVRRALFRLCPDPPEAGGVRCCENCFGVSETGRLEASVLLAMLRRIPEGWSEILTHPALPDAELLQEYRWDYRWEEEVRALCGGEAKEEITRLGITLEKG